MDKYTKTNLLNWNTRVSVHAGSRFYGVAGFKRGKTSLKPLEIQEVGPVKGKSLLHLQCHFGMDTLSWARLGAKATGADFSDKAIAQARQLAAETGIAADFVHSEIYGLPKRLNGKFDIVFASYGVLCWIGDLGRWMKTAAHFLKPGGIIYVAEDHPFAAMFDEGGEKIEAPYFAGRPRRYPPGCTYTDGRNIKMPSTYEWSHPISEILGAVMAGGLRLEFLHEFPYCAYRRFKGMKKRADGFYVPADNKVPLPLLFSLKAVKE